MPQYFRRRRTPSRGRNNRRLQPDVFPHRRIKPPRVHIDQYCPREDISRQESSDYRRVAIAASTNRRNDRRIALKGARDRCNQSNVFDWFARGVSFERLSQLSMLEDCYGPARSFRFSGFAMASIRTNTYCEPLTYAQLAHSDSRHFRVAFIHSVPADQPKQQCFL